MSSDLEIIEQLLDRGDLRRAGVLLERLGNTTDLAQLTYLKAKHAYLTHNFNLAIQYLETHSPETPQALELLGNSYLGRFQYSPVGHSRRSDMEQALTTFFTVLEKYPYYENAGWVQYQIGLSLSFSDNPKSAIDHFRLSIQLPAHDSAVKSYAYERIAHITFYVEREFKQALSFLDLAIAVYPAYSPLTWLIQANLFKARVLQTLKREAEVSQTVQQAVKLAYQTTEMTVICDTLLSAGELLAQMSGHEQNAIAYLREYLTLRSQPEGIDVSWARANEVLGDLAFSLADYQSSLVYYKAVLASNPFHPLQAGIYYRIGKSHYQLGQYHATIETIQHLLDVMGRDQVEISDFRIYDILGSAYFAVGNYQQATDAYQNALNLAPSSVTADKIRLYHHYALQLSQKQ